MEDNELGKKINSRSVIWNYFGLKLDKNGYIYKTNQFAELASEASQ